MSRALKVADTWARMLLPRDPEEMAVIAELLGVLVSVCATCHGYLGTTKEANGTKGGLSHGVCQGSKACLAAWGITA